MKIQLLWPVVLHSPWLHTRRQRHVHIDSHSRADLYTVTRLPTHTSYNVHSSLTQWNLNALNTQINKHTLTTHSTTKSFENPEGAISKSAKEKRMIILLRVNLGAFCDYGYLFGAAWKSQLQNKRKYRSLLGYENTCRPQIISRSLSAQQSFIGSIATSLTPHPPTLVSLALYSLLIFFCRWVFWGEKEHLPLVLGQLSAWYIAHYCFWNLFSLLPAQKAAT